MEPKTYLITDIHNFPLFTIVARTLEEAMHKVKEGYLADLMTGPVRVYVEAAGSPYTPERH